MNQSNLSHELKGNLIMELNVSQTKEMFKYVSDKILENKPLLTEIDSAIGDGDHGIGMSVGFKQAKENLEGKDCHTINDVFKTIGMAMINSMGGASGVIFGTMFVGGVKKLEKKEMLTVETLTTLFTHSLSAIKTRGKAEIGDKTMIDALQPAVEALQNTHVEQDLLTALKQATNAANEGVEKSKEYVAKFGRAKTLGERAIGYQDAGATSVWIIFDSMTNWVENHVK
ncbi:dihydroxyacetone kinase subunit DhaL [Gracilibacillus halophilus YIM-C55.5]|uniref:phosphoenolpyruvate--glycerone phosphotransferase n=1 Tax=Gracilibacillus halophilus YIM-C55.5 TaxID=1308866 RepID=N4WJ21_9BACI|nr:dihydroxyacetone kinase subunit DhaL [Gracilibacillus halophilus]ENH96137.1 dihydroxyacetone kinase subunit DhaL [Gracilibacillus halophilus YIM-C55.5]